MYCLYDICSMGSSECNEWTICILNDQIFLSIQHLTWSVRVQGTTESKFRLKTKSTEPHQSLYHSLDHPRPCPRKCPRQSPESQSRERYLNRSNIWVTIEINKRSCLENDEMSHEWETDGLKPLKMLKTASCALFDIKTWILTFTVAKGYCQSHHL